MPGLPPVDFVMAFDYGRLAIHHASAARNLSLGWEVLPYRGGFAAAPSIHWAEEDEYFYVISGGHVIRVARSRDLRTWESSRYLVASPHPADDATVAPFMGMENLVAWEPSGILRADLANPGCWDHNSNDADFCCGGPLTGGGAPANKSFVM